ncbi:hypothetical protein ACSBR1_029706 [Camellia fascicularis]
MRHPWRSTNEYEGQLSKLGIRGWQPVVRIHGGQGSGAQRENNIYSVFVDNIPASMGANELYKIFSNYGVVLDAYIPNKRIRSTGSRFGFIRRGYGDITVRIGGGRQLVISFQLVEARREKLLLMKECLTDWCESVDDWEEGMVFDQVRNNEESYSSNKEEEIIVERGSRQEKEDDDVEVHVKAEVDKGCELATGNRAIEQVPNYDMEEEA